MNASLSIIYKSIILIIFLEFVLFLPGIGQELTVMSYNIYHGENPYQPGTSNLEAVAKILNKHSPDFAAMQEVDSMTQRTAGFNDGRRINLVAELADATDMTGYFAKAIDYSQCGYGEGVLVRNPTVVQTHGKHMLPIPEGGEDRTVLYVTGKTEKNRELVFAGTHLCHQYEANRLAQAEELVRYFRQMDEPVILCGDFNFKPGSEPYQVMTKYFDDAALLYGDPQNTFSAKNPRVRIDFIFLSRNHKWEVSDFQVLRETASDHMPVLANIRLLD